MHGPRACAMANGDFMLVADIKFTYNVVYIVLFIVLVQEVKFSVRPHIFYFTHDS